jgi:hypothetical protein
MPVVVRTCHCGVLCVPALRQILHVGEIIHDARQVLVIHCGILPTMAARVGCLLLPSARLLLGSCTPRGNIPVWFVLQKAPRH